ncbi:MAG TPA: CBS domain-containing protein, partial [bacterium]|nr:CBS domain-containing protein [bacterium]
LFIAFGVWQIISGRLINGLWIVFVGWFLETAAASSGRQVAIHDLLTGHLVRDLMAQDYPTVSPDLVLETVIHDHILATGWHTLPVVQDGRFVGLLTLDEIKAIPRAAWPTTRVRNVMTPRDRVPTVTPDTDLAVAVDALGAGTADVLPVVDSDSFVGAVSRHRVVAFLQAQAALGA